MPAETNVRNTAARMPDTTADGGASRSRAYETLRVPKFLDLIGNQSNSREIWRDQFSDTLNINHMLISNTIICGDCEYNSF